MGTNGTLLGYVSVEQQRKIALRFKGTDGGRSVLQGWRMMGTTLLLGGAVFSEASFLPWLPVYG